MSFSTSAKILIGVAVIVTAILVIRLTRTSAADAGANLGTVKRQDLEQRVTISGQIWPKHRLDIKAPYNGYITKLYVKIGDRLKRGDPIVTFSPSLASGEVNFPVRVGFDGVVTQTLKTEGEYVTESGDQNPLVVRVEDLSELSVLGAVPELDIAKIKVGLAANVRVSSLVGENFLGTISEVGLSAKDKDRYGYGSSATEFQIRVALKEHDQRLLPGMSTVMDIIADRRQKVLVLPHEYIQEDDKGYFATTSRGEIKRLKLGLQTNEAAEILSGLREGEQVRPIDFLNLPKITD